MGFDEDMDNITDTKMEVFKGGEIIDAEIIDGNDVGETCDLQFGDGSVAYSVQRDCFIIVEDKKGK